MSYPGAGIPDAEFTAGLTAFLLSPNARNLTELTAPFTDQTLQALIDSTHVLQFRRVVLQLNLAAELFSRDYPTIEDGEAAFELIEGSAILAALRAKLGTEAEIQLRPYHEHERR